MKDRLDSAIDTVAARLTSVREEPGLALRIVEALPPRSAWSLQWLMPRLAITAVLAIATAFVVLQPFNDRSTNVLRTEVASGSRPLVEPASNDRRTAVEPSSPVEPLSTARRTGAELPSNDLRTDADHEFSLPAINAVAALDIDALAPASLSEDARLTIESLEISSLPLTADFSQQ